jgi:hypothetical protein
MAAPLNLLPDKPDIFWDAISFSYNAGTDVFTADGSSFGSSPYMVDPSLTNYTITGAHSFNITANIDNTGTPTAGTLTINGSIVALSAGPSLLTGFLTDVGFPLVYDEPLEFLFTVSGGDLAVPGLYGTPGVYQIGIILSEYDVGMAPINWNQSFDNSFDIVGSVTDTFHVAPEPASIFLLAPIFALAASRSRKRR